MTLGEEKYRLDFYKDSPKGKILRTMTLTDINYWGVDSFIGIILVLYVIQFMHGGSATHLGLAYLLYKTVSALASIPLGRFFDEHKGHLDEVWGLAFSGFGAGIVYMLLSFSRSLWELYLAMFCLGLISVVQMLSCRTLFYSNIEKAEYSRTIGIYQALLSLFQGFAIALGGFVGDTFGYQTVVFYGGLIVFLGGFLPLGVRLFVAKE